MVATVISWIALFVYLLVFTVHYQPWCTLNAAMSRLLSLSVALVTARQGGCHFFESFFVFRVLCSQYWRNVATHQRTASSLTSDIRNGPCGRRWFDRMNHIFFPLSPSCGRLHAYRSFIGDWQRQQEAFSLIFQVLCIPSLILALYNFTVYLKRFKAVHM